MVVSLSLEDTCTSSGRWVVWWLISAGAVVEALKIMGYADCEVTTHTQLHLHGHNPANPWVEQPMYTVVAHRT